MKRGIVAGLALAALGAAPACAFDCKRAASASEKAICANPVALAADADLGKAFEALRTEADPKARPQMVAAELAWLKRRDGDCADQKDPALAACLAAQSRARLAFLTGTPEAGPGATGGLAPVFRMQKGAKGRADIDVEVLKFVDASTPAARAFNAEVDKLSADVEDPEKDDPAADRYAYAWSMRLAYASRRLVSAHAEGYADIGGAHPNTFTANINIDVAAGRAAMFDALLDNASAQKVFALCLKQVKDQRREREGEDEADAGVMETIAKNVADATGDLKVWSFGGDAATLTYDPEAIGAYAEGAFGCVLPYSMLRPLAKASFPLP